MKKHLDGGKLSQLIPVEDWELCRPVIRDAREAGIPCAIGGGLAFSFYSCRQRNTKDVDLLVKPSDKDRIIEILTRNGFEDYYDQHEYDRTWIYRGFRDGVIVDIIWTLPNHRFEVDDEWFRRCASTRVHDEPVCLITPEDLIRVKLFVIQRERSDWPDVLNLIHQQGPTLQWKTLLCLLGEDTPLLGAALQVYGWLEPAGAAKLPPRLWGAVGIRPPESLDDTVNRKFLLDTRDWFGPTESVAAC